MLNVKYRYAKLKLHSLHICMPENPNLSIATTVASNLVDLLAETRFAGGCPLRLSLINFPAHSTMSLAQ